MKARMRGGPKNKRVMAVKDGTARIEMLKMPELSLHDWDKVGVIGTTVQGHYTIVNEPLKDGSYYFVWMGWEDEK